MARNEIKDFGSGAGIRLKVFLTFFKRHQVMSIRNLLSTLGCGGSPNESELEPPEVGNVEHIQTQRVTATSSICIA